MTQEICVPLHSQRGLVRVTVAPADRSGTHVIICVEDTGIGISQEKIPHIWGAFEQVRGACLVCVWYWWDGRQELRWGGVGQL